MTRIVAMLVTDEDLAWRLLATTPGQPGVARTVMVDTDHPHPTRSLFDGTVSLTPAKGDLKAVLDAVVGVVGRHTLAMHEDEVPTVDPRWPLLNQLATVLGPYLRVDS